MPSGRGASLTRPVLYPSDDLTEAERARLAPHVTDLDGPVFALVNLPETVKGALFARYSRYPGTLRRLFLEEFADSLPAGRQLGRQRGRARRAALRADLRRLRRRLGRPARRRARRLRVGLERDDEGAPAAAARGVPGAVDALHRLRRADAGRRLPLLPRRRARAGVRGSDGRAVRRLLRRAPARARVGRRRRYPRAEGESEAARARAVNAKALDLLRGLLPASSLSHMGIYATGQAYEQLILHLIGHPLPEARRYGELILAAIKAVMPSFVSRVERPDRGGAWASYLAERRAAGERWAARLGLEDADPARRPPVGDADPRRRRRGAAAGGAPVRVVGRERGADPRRRGRDGRRRARRAAAATSSASAPTAATGRGAASRRCATASRSSPTTARSATSSATGC